MSEMKYIPRLLSLLLAISCGSPSKAPDTKQASVVAGYLPALRDSVPKCDGMAVATDGSYDGCHSPNGGLWHGQLCFSGEAWACEQMYRFMREDSLVKAPLHPEANHGGSGSRDELVGHLLYVVKTRDKAHMEKILSVIDSNGNRVCTDAADNRCEVTPAMWGLIRIVCNFIGLKVPLRAYAGNVGDDTSLVFAANTAPLGYQLHLVLLELLIRRHTNTWSSKCQDTLEVVARRWPDNLLAVWLSGKDVSKQWIQEVEGKDWSGVQRDWRWESVKHERPLAASYLFLGNLIAGENK